MTTKTHWKKLTTPNYLGSWDVPEGGQLLVTIKSVSQQTVTGPDGVKDDCVVAQLEGQKPLVLNATNCKRIARITGTNYVEDWAGQQICLVVKKVKAFGSEVDALRVKSGAAKPKETLTPDSPRWAGAVKALKEGTCTLELVTHNIIQRLIL